MPHCPSLVLSICLFAGSDLVPVAVARPARITFVGAVVNPTCVGSALAVSSSKTVPPDTWRHCSGGNTDARAFRVTRGALTDAQIAQLPAVAWLRRHGEPDIAASIVIRTRIYR